MILEIEWNEAVDHSEALRVRNEVYQEERRRSDWQQVEQSGTSEFCQQASLNKGSGWVTDWLSGWF